MRIYLGTSQDDWGKTMVGLVFGFTLIVALVAILMASGFAGVTVIAQQMPYVFIAMLPVLFITLSTAHLFVSASQAAVCLGLINLIAYLILSVLKVVGVG